MPEPLLSTCCRCQTLKTGSIICGILGIIFSIITLIAMFVIRVEFRTLDFNWLPSNVVKIIFAINLCMTILISLLLIIGILKRNHLMMLPWVILGVALAVTLLISIIWTVAVFFIDGYILAGVLWLILGLLAVVIYSYMWMVVYSHFTILLNESKRGRYNKQPYRR